MASTTSPSNVTPTEVRAYISDMLSQLADLARSAGDRRLEASMRLLAAEAEIHTPGGRLHRRHDAELS